jgi:hypothetical protein
VNVFADTDGEIATVIQNQIAISNVNYPREKTSASGSRFKAAIKRFTLWNSQVDTVDPFITDSERNLGIAIISSVVHYGVGNNQTFINHLRTG